jgi:hypothetical protein
MNWRPWIITALFLGVIVVNTALMFFEEVATPESAAEVLDEVKDKLALIPFTAATRLGNFKSFGMPDDLAEATVDQARRIASRKERYQELLKEHADEVGITLCAGGMPQRYAALAFLVEEQEGKRIVIPYDRVTYFEVREWYDPGQIQDIYNEVELANPPLEASTAMGISAIILGREAQVIEGTSPWGKGLGARWSFDRVLSKFPEVKKNLVEYFAFMHVLTEIANADGGICG